jgi:DNA-binding NarL/FixJ family response regulator
MTVVAAASFRRAAAGHRQGTGVGTIRILVADDHCLVRRGLRGLLETRLGWNVVAEVADGYSAIAAAITTLPDVAVIDSSMPQMNGIEAIRRIHQKLPKLEICFLSDNAEEAGIAAALRAGARGIVLKSDPEKELLNAVESLSRHRPHFSPSVSDALLITGGRRDDAERPIEFLTPREREIVQLVAEGFSNKEVGVRLDLSIKTVETHRCAAMRKAGVSSTANLVRYAVRNHIVQP